LRDATSLGPLPEDGLRKLKNPMETTGTTSQLIVKNGAVWRRPSSSSGEQQADNDDDDVTVEPFVNHE